MIGKDLTSFQFPVSFSEPISFTSRGIEVAKHSYLLKEATFLKSSAERCAYVTSYCITIFGYFLRRINKPFNPLLGETFEFECDDWKGFAEQVSHHPPITAYYIESKYFKLEANTSMSIRFCGKNIEVVVNSTVYVTLMNPELGINEKYEMKFPKINVTNMIFGKMQFNFWGDWFVKNMNNGDICKVKMNAGTGLFMKEIDKGKIEGVVFEKDSDVPKFQVSGSWLREVFISQYNENISDFESPVQVFKLPIVEGDDDSDWDEIYRLNDIALNSNAMDDDLALKLPPTDSRFRPDMIAMEKGEWDYSTQEKLRLEKEQRERKKEDDSEKLPVYFTKTIVNQKTNAYLYEFGSPRNYWEDRENQDWDHLPRYFD